MDVVFYKNTSDRRKVGKALEEVARVSAKVKESCSILKPELYIMSDSTVNVNYIYIPLLKRYYFVDDIIFMEGKIKLFKCSVDVLESYKKEIKDLKCIVVRQEYKFNPYYNDAMLPVRTDTNYKVQTFGNVTESYNFYITTVGGVK